jgi:hypothetical protein
MSLVVIQWIVASVEEGRGGLGPVVGDFIVAQQTEASEISASFVRDAMEREKASRQVRGLPLD